MTKVCYGMALLLLGLAGLAYITVAPGSQSWAAVLTGCCFGWGVVCLLEVIDR